MRYFRELSDPVVGRHCRHMWNLEAVVQELLRTNDVVRLEYVRAVLGEEGIETFVFDGHMSITEGSIGILPRRLMVTDDDADRARTILREVGEEIGPDEQAAW